jgi:hypothetical protein
VRTLVSSLGDANHFAGSRFLTKLSRSVGWVGMCSTFSCEFTTNIDTDTRCVHAVCPCLRRQTLRQAICD